MRLALFDVRAWLDPVARFFVELFPLRLHSLARPRTGQHYDADAVGGAAGILGQGVADRRQLGLREEPLPGLLVITLDPLAWVALNGIAPWQASHRPSAPAPARTSLNRQPR